MSSSLSYGRLTILALLGSLISTGLVALGDDLPTAEELERGVIEYRKSIHSADLLLNHRMSVYVADKSPTVRERTTTIFLRDNKIRNDVVRSSSPGAKPFRNVNCRNCEVDGFHVFYTDIKVPRSEIMLEMHSVAEVSNQPANFPVIDPRALGMAADSSPNLAKLKTIGAWVGRADRTAPTVTRERYKDQDCCRLEYRFVPESGVVRQWFALDLGPSMLRMEKEFTYRDMTYLDSVECDYQQYQPSMVWFPNTVTYQRKVGGVLQEDEIVKVSVRSLNEEISPIVFFIAGMEVPAGTYIAGHPISEDAAVWDGKAITPYGEGLLSGAVPSAAGGSTPAKSGKGYGPLLVGNGLVFLCLAIWLLVRNARRRSQSTLDQGDTRTPKDP